MSDSLKKILFWLLALAFVAPILVSSKFFFPFIVTKTFFFRLVVEIAAVVYVVLAFVDVRYRPRFSFLHWAVLAYLGAATLGSLFGINLERSFWGNAERGEGLLTLYHVGAFFFLLSFTVKERREWMSLFATSLVVAILTALYGLAQLIGLKQFLIFNIIGSGRIASTIGNASFFAGYLLLNILLAAVLFWEKRTFPWRIFSGASFLFLLFVLYATETRGALLGFLVGLLVLAGLLILSSPLKKLKLGAAAGITLIVLLGGLVWLGRNSNLVKTQPTLRRLATISREDITTQSRLATWKVSLDGWRGRPIFGWGYENYNVAFNERFPTVIYRDEGSQVWFDRAHNAFLDVLVTSGIVGFLAYLAIFAGAAMLLWKLFRKGERFLAILLTAGFVAYIFQNLFVFDTLGTYILFAGLLAFLTALIPQRGEAEASAVSSLGVVPVAATLLLIVLLLPAFYFFNVKPAQANRAIARGITLQRFNRFEEAKAAFAEALRIGTYMRFEGRAKIADLAVGMANRRDVSVPLLNSVADFAILEMEKNMQEEPQDLQHVMILATLNNNFSAGRHERFERALALAEQALKMSPTRPQIYYEIGQAWASQKEYPKAIAAFQKAVEMAPWVMEAHWNLAAAYVFAGDLEKADREFEEAGKRGLDLNSLRHLERLARVYAGAKQLRLAAETYEKIITLVPSVGQNYATLAAIYKELGDIARACTVAQQAMEVDQGFSTEAALFVKQLGCKT